MTRPFGGAARRREQITVGNVYEADISGRKLSIESGRWAKQAGGSAVVTYGESVVLVTACVTETARPGIDFLPLVVDYVEKTFAVGKIPGGFFKREGRLSEFEVLTSRLIDRPMRPLRPTSRTTRRSSR
jgi:polyribonucleotide nucleotidyltransferase